MVISTLSMSQENVDSIKNLLTGDYLEQLDIVVSDYFYSHERHSLIKYMYEHLDINDSFQLAVCRTHTKITLIETECGKWLTIHGSANLRSSDNIEMFSVENSKDLYDFNLEWHDEIINKYQTINKMVRSLDSWQAEVVEVGKKTDLQHTARPKQQNEQELKPAKSKAW